MSCIAIAYCTCDNINFNWSWRRLKVALTSCATFIIGKSSAGKVCKLKRDLPAVKVRRLSAQSNFTIADSGSARKMSCSFLALVVMRKSSVEVSGPVVWI